MLKNLSIKYRLIFVIGFLSVQLIVGALIGIISLGIANDKMRSLYDDRLVALGQLDQVVRLLNINVLDVAKAIDDEPAEAAKLMGEVESNIQQINKVWDMYMATSLTADEKRLAEQFAENRKKFVAEGLNPAIAAVRAQDKPRALDLLHGKLEELFNPVRQGINDLIKLQLDVARSDYEHSQSTYTLVRNSCTAGLLLGLVLAAFVGIWIVRAITKPLDAAVKIADGIAGGNLTQQIDVRSTDETG
ncbi:MAG TPA: Tar ligand binding domain-containing protein, partial [Noviherbaspirillum sp.]|nr:Tar ligand binding domain-containing protein [Noviherbaspirillum sp.]